jgi:hypothetical protein
MHPCIHASWSEQQSSALSVPQTTPNSRMAAPTVTLVLPATGPNTGNFQVALIGLNFIAGSRLSVRLLAENQRQGMMATTAAVTLL